MPFDLATAEHAAFVPHLGKVFRLKEPVVAELELVEARASGLKRWKNAKRDPFSIYFKGKPGLRLSQGIYRLENEEFGAMEVFLVQLSDGTEGSEFEAVFG